MIIKIIPENDKEKAYISEVEHKNVKEFFIFGNKQDTDGDLLDFHDWHGSYRFLLGSLGYFTTIISDERRNKEVPENRMRVMPGPGLDPNMPNMGGDSFPVRSGKHPQMIKYGTEEGKPQIIDVEQPLTQETKDDFPEEKEEQKPENIDLKLL
ncbi:MAG: hypothetical protein WC375_06230 [Methanomassiliicoccales archaeon]|jgi:hypothetical protein